ncbi:MAG: type 1 glutamine amidotransferase [Dechloromonas agitata]|uniref:Type 1 glutamine amidotransferase n=1 Tax=Dechloromonas agitata TaxID=73030 RepID=A0A930BXY3_9RHOO|nr:type 1 glutamine amidotransferase [Dechloromonas agitata]
MRILVFQHHPAEHPGVLRDFWKEAGHEWTAVELDEGETIPSFDGYDLLVVMGGPMDTWQEDLHPWLVREKAAIREWVKDLGRPYLGICLGHQLLAAALGGEVSPMKGPPEVGLARVTLTSEGLAAPLLKGFPEEIETFQWHGAEVSRMPEGAVVLARNPACPSQAFRWGPVAYGFQYHVEITETTVADWERIPEYFVSLQKALGKERAASLADEVRPRLPAFRQAARQLNTNLEALLSERIA